MQEALSLAIKGLGTTAPNPMVGCVIVKNNEIIGSGHTQPYGGSHAEVVAIQSVADKALLKNSTLYVTLEPCAHFGKTPPCVDLIIDHKIPHVVIACLDPFKKVNGKGIEKLIKAGINVTVGILEKEARWMNRRFFIFHEQKRPYIILKWAQTADGFISKLPVPENRSENQISNADTNKLVHQWRSEEQAILVGNGTIIADNPSLNVRLVEGKNPVRIVIDGKGILNKTYKVFNDNVSRTVVFTHSPNKALKDIEQIIFEPNNFMKSLNTFCFENNILSVFIEGGLQTHQYFIDNHLCDEIRIIKSSITFSSGIEAPKLNSIQATENFAIKNNTIEVYNLAK